MRSVRALVCVACAGLIIGVGLGAQEPGEPQATFRTGVDVIRLDVSVLDKARRPVRGLKAEDFTVLENGKPQRIVAVSEVDAAARDPVPTAWMRHAAPDVIGNDLADQLDGGRAVAIVFDELNVPVASEVAVATRELGRYIVNSLAPSDLAAVVFPLNPGKTQDFTQDRSRLLDAIDRFKAEEPEFRWLGLSPPGPMQGDVQRYSPTLSREPCLQLHPAVPALRAVTSRLAGIPNQRKTVFLVSVGVPVPFAAGRTRCQTLLFEELRATFRDAQRGNVNIHTIDPAGARGYQRQLQESRLVNGRMTQAADAFGARQLVETRHDFLVTAADQTGGRAVVDTDAIGAEVDQIFAETSSYYLIGYEPASGAADGKFRHVEVKVNRPDTSARTAAGYWAPEKDAVVAAERRDAPASNTLNLLGMMSPQKLVLRAGIQAVARSPKAGEVDVAAVVTVRVPAVRQRVDETVRVVRTISPKEGQSGPPVAQTTSLTLEPGTGDELRYDVLSTFSLPPGRYDVRFNATSRIADASGSVYAEIEVPDLSRPGVVLTDIVIGTEPSGPRTDALAGLTPIVPTTSRDFTAGDRVSAFARVFEGGTADLVPVEIALRIVGERDAEAATKTETIPVERFVGTRVAEFQTDLPLSGLKPGLYLLSLTATADGRSTRRDVRFRVR